jgi:hypothetical protein
MHTIVSRPLGSQSPTVIHGRYLLFEWPAARLQSARASHCRSTWRTGHLHQPGPGHHATRDITSFVAATKPLGRALCDESSAEWSAPAAASAPS